MPQSNRLLATSVLLVQACRLVNAITVAFMIAALIATLPGAEWVEAALVRKYQGRVDPQLAIVFMQGTMLLAIPVGYAVERLFAALRAILRSVQDGVPFAFANAARIRTIGWAMLVVQLADLGFGLATVFARALHLDYLGWQPSVTGWIAVLVAFVLAQVFERGTAMQGDLEGTV